MALSAAGWRLLRTAPLCIPASRSAPPCTERNGSFQANLSLSQRRWRQPKCESRGLGRGERGKEGFIHCLPLQCGGCCCSEATPGTNTFPPRHNFTPKTPRGPLPFAKVKRLPWFAGGCVAAKELRLDAALPPADTEPSDNGTCRGYFAASTPLAICFRGRRGAGRAMLHG